MDLTTIAVSLLTAKNQSTMATLAARFIKDDLGSQNAVAQLLTSADTSINSAATAASHLGTNLDVTV